MKIAIQVMDNVRIVVWRSDKQVPLVDAVQAMADDLPKLFADFNRPNIRDQAPDVETVVNVSIVESGEDVPYLTIRVESDPDELPCNKAHVEPYDLIWKTFVAWFDKHRYSWPANWHYDHNEKGMTNVNGIYRSW